jgi:hypothetical protein
MIFTKYENPSQWFAGEFLGEKKGRSISKISADKMEISVSEFHSLLFIGVSITFLIFANSRKK